ncbi:zinc ribbon domain-containing protein [Haloarcula quadrata]|uniref:zinc ribbon domain-containing protein n=1 Tax=Haloarcula quadrata TaxID=182779 RepID=UPI00374400F2
MTDETLLDYEWSECPSLWKTATTGGGLSKMFDIQTNSFKLVSCRNCGYSELYRDTTASSNDIVE